VPPREEGGLRGARRKFGSELENRRMQPESAGRFWRYRRKRREEGQELLAAAPALLCGVPRRTIRGQRLRLCAVAMMLAPAAGTDAFATV
jgi:hypothetical protein